MDSNGKDSAQLEREVESKRQQVEDRIGQIRERLSPGQLFDELLGYTKHGGQHFAANLGSTIASNPLPAALLGVSLAWLMSGQGPRFGAPGNGAGHPSHRTEHDDYPYATVSGGLRRTSLAADHSGAWYSEWQDNAGKRYKAPSSDAGHRMGHFMDDAGRKFGGFIDEAGHRIKDFQDEAGNRMDDATGWASHTWHDLQQGAAHMVDQVAHQAQELGGNAQAQMDRASRAIMDTFHNQPLVAGALAFAAGAALGTALPHTSQEDQAVGKIADQLKGKAAEVASDVYEDGKEKAADLYDKSKAGAAKVYEKAKDQVADRSKSIDLN